LIKKKLIVHKMQYIAHIRHASATSTPQSLPARKTGRPIMQHDDITRAIGARVRDGRARLAMSRKSLAATAGVSERYLHQLETGTANASVGILVRVAEALQLDFAVLVTGGEGPAPEKKGASGSITLDHAPLALFLAGLSATEQMAAAPVMERFIGERRRQSRGIALLGLRGAGKSTIGQALAARRGWPFLSVTREIEARAGMGVDDLFNLGGAEAYRGLENEVVAELARRGDRVVLETAGGIAGNGVALETILVSFKTVWLKASPEEHLNRVAGQGDTRPTRGNPKAIEHLRSLLAQREPGYARAELILDTTGKSLEACVAELVAITGAVPER
jgi:XRE family transcriptional regulator, aerobic/anaerobic benzoate catabolism transcriptional regulator